MQYLDTHTAIVGASGAGKTVTAKGHVEALLGLNRHVCILDPTSAWWGLRSDASGNEPGFDIPIFGGSHGDVAITADQGEAVGAIVAGGVSAIVDISDLRTGSEQRRFARDLLRRLRAKPNGNFHMVVDEADEFAAQKPRDDYGFQVGEELIWMAKRGRLAGFVLSLVTQRPASIDKEVLTQAQTLIVHQLVAPVDQKPIIDYLKDNADKATLGTIKASLASLAQGERWIYAPRLCLLERGVSPMPVTFDSSRTPEPGEQAVEPKMLASIDLGEIRKALAITEAKPLNDLPAAHKSSDSLKSWATVDLIDELDRRDPQWINGHSEFQAAVQDRNEFQAEAERLHSVIAAYQRAFAAQATLIGDISWPSVERKDGTMPHEPLVIPPVVAAPPPAPKSARQPTPARDIKLGAERRPLAALAQVYPSGLTEAQWATSAGMKRRGGTWGTYKSRLRSAGLIEGHEGRWFATEAGAGAVGEVELPPPPGPDLARWWAGKLQSVGPMVEALVASYPRWLSREDLAGALNMSASGGSFGTYLSRLSGPGLIERGPSGIRLSDEVIKR